jgi:hypothetical protein
MRMSLCETGGKSLFLSNLSENGFRFKFSLRRERRERERERERESRVSRLIPEELQHILVQIYCTISTVPFLTSVKYYRIIGKTEAVHKLKFVNIVSFIEKLRHIFAFQQAKQEILVTISISFSPLTFCSKYIAQSPLPLF